MKDAVRISSAVNLTEKESAMVQLVFGSLLKAGGSFWTLKIWPDLATCKRKEVEALRNNEDDKQKV